MKKANVEAYINAHPEWQTTLETLRSIILSTKLEECIKWGIPVYCLDGKNVVGLAAFKSYAGLWFYNGGVLNDKAKVLINAQPEKTQAMRQWRFAQAAQLHEALILTYINEAIYNQKKGIEIKPRKTLPINIPQELAQHFMQSSELLMQFEQLNMSKQREYAEYISTAKQKATKTSRLEKIIPMIKQGLGLNDKYR